MEAIQLVEQQAQHPGGWTRERIELVKRTICPKGVSDDEFALFIEQCKRSGLDPLLKEAFYVGRRHNAGTRERPNWVIKHEFQPSEAGMLARAERFPDFLGIQASAVYGEDEIAVDQGEGKVVHRFNPAKRKGSVVGAWARVVRSGSKLPVVVWLDFGGYVQQTPLWSKIPTTMIEKCARVAALRKAYPEAFGGLYIREEMPPEDVAGEVVSLKEPKALPASTVTPEQQLAPEKQKVRAELLEKISKTVGLAPGAKVTFGPHKNEPISELSDSELSGCIDLGNSKLAEDPKAKWAKSVQENITLLVAEVDLRKLVRVEPGANG